ncbi:MAG: fluoride efflux transporter CrcB [Sphingomonadales bacterium]
MLVAIAAGGALGAVARHFVSHQVALWLGHSFPFGTMGVNALGSFLLGILVTLLAESFSLSQELRGFLVVGLLGGFTTFSAFSLETVLLIERNQMALAGLYVTGSVLLGVFGLFAGIYLARVMV